MYGMKFPVFIFVLAVIVFFNYPLLPQTGSTLPGGDVGGVADEPSVTESYDKSGTGEGAVYEGNESLDAVTDTGEGEQEAFLPVPDTYRGIQLGMSLDEVKEVLKTEPVFGYRGERDVSMIPNPDRTLIETFGTGYIKKAWFQFSEDKLYIMTVVLDSDKIDYYSMYQSLSKKYGEPDSLSPRKALWNSDTVRLSLEKPLSVKYIDSVIYDSLLKESQAGIDYEELLQESFIESF
ncbi:MAG: hypothetical protein IAA81_08570 [Spirochaetes bacterium]|uniref:Uncharacterized protein n=1 Tax=Candidatus Gallitreponema excrementavium TaxID=2840840 RepID=A0A9D9HQZ9_9SPIR|nr:hypothetical protein [Candidatus Gallitreponema excrementavium]